MMGSRKVLCYTRKATGREQANNEDIAYSVHIAVRMPEERDWTPLNENYGIFFAAGVPTQDASKQARAASTAARRFPGEPLPQGRAGSEALKHHALMPGDDIELKSLRDPYLFRLKDRRFAIVATRTARGGSPDGSERSGFLLAVSENLTAFDRRGMIVLNTTQGVNRPAVEFDAANGSYELSWWDDQGRSMVAHTADIEEAVQGVLAAGPGEPVLRQPAACDGSSCGIDDAVVGNTLDITSEEADTLFERYGRLSNTGVSVKPATFPATGDCAGVREALDRISRTPATLTYSDGSTATRAVQWDGRQLHELERDAAAGVLRSGQTRLIRGTVRAERYPVPFAVERADPSIFAFDWNGEPLFMFIATEDEGGNCIDPRNGNAHMPLRVGRTIAELADANGGREREIDLLVTGDVNTEGRVMTGCFWAPELHIIGGALCVLFMPCFDGPDLNPDGSANDRAGKPDMWTGSCHIMKLGKDASGRDLDPREPANWSVPEPILGPDGESLNPVQRISLDMTVFEDSGDWYYAWQQVGSVWIARVDPHNPSRVADTPRQIIVPEFAWDNMIAEGPNVLVHDGTIFMIYSGSLVGIDYTTGLVTAPAGCSVDLTDPESWTKLDYPLQKSGVYNGAWQLGTGHGMWSHDEDGNLIYVFHNAEYDNGQYGGRDAQVRRVHWSAEGMPILDMQAQEELDPAYAEPTMEVKVV